MKLNHIIRKAILNSLGLILLFNSSFGSGILSSSLLRRTSPPATTYIAQTALLSPVRFCSTVTEGFDIIEFNRKNKAPWLDKKQAKKRGEFLDISQFCADPERGILYRYQSWNPKLQKDYRVQAADRDLYAQTLEIERREENIKRAKALHKTGKLKKNEIAALFEISESDI